MLAQVQEPTDSEPRPRHVAVIQLGGELACAMTRGWVEALAGRSRVDILTRLEHREILDLGQAGRCHGLGRGPFELLRLANMLNTLSPDRAIRLDDGIAGRLLGTVCGAEKRALTWRESQRPAAIDAALGSIFRPLGVDAPRRTGPLRLSPVTTRRAHNLLAQFGLACDRSVVMHAPDAESLSQDWSCAPSATTPGLPVVLMPPGEELDLIARLAGHAWLVQAGDLALRAALIGCARLLVSDHPASVELATLMQTRVAEPVR